MDCPQCRSPEVDSSGACRVCGYRVDAANQAGDAAAARALSAGSAQGLGSGEPLPAPASPEDSELPEWRRELTRRLQKIKARRDSMVPGEQAAARESRPSMRGGAEPAPGPRKEVHSAPPPSHRPRKTMRHTPAVAEGPPERPGATSEPGASRDGAAPPTEHAPVLSQESETKVSPEPASEPVAEHQIPAAPLGLMFEGPHGPAKESEPDSLLHEMREGGPHHENQREVEAAPGPDLAITHLIDDIMARQAARAASVAGTREEGPVSASPAPASLEVEEQQQEGRLILLSRTLSGLVDFTVVFLCGFGCVMAAEMLSGFVVVDGVSWLSFALLLAMIFFLYSTFFLATAGQTIGMMITDLQLLRLDRRRPRFAQILVRCAAYLLALAGFGIGLIWGLFDQEAACLHDRLSATRVARVPWLLPPGGQ